MKVAGLCLSLACGLLLPAHASAEYRISGPYTHENLSIFLIHGNGGGRNYLTLKDAVAQKKVVVSETKKVNELAVENVSGEPVFIQGGDIVKGGQQDRVISNDFVLPSKSGKVPVSAFCVENGRWTQRGAESPRVFASSSDMIATKDLKMAVKAKKSQTEVWREVANTQAALGVASVSVSASPTSLQLTLESKAVSKAIDGYLKALSSVTTHKPDVVGFAFAISGDVNSADVYSSPALFTAMWFEPPTPETVNAFLRDAEDGRQSTVDVDQRVKLVTLESDKQVLFESREGAGWIHRNYIKK